MTWLRRWQGIAGVLAVLAATMTGCGGRDRSLHDRGPAEVVQQFAVEVAAGRASAACDLLTARGRRDLATIAAAAGLEEACIGAIGLMHGAYTEAELEALRDVHVTNTQVDGDRAWVRMSDVDAPGGVEFFDTSVGDGRIVLVRERLRWRIDTFR
jgi:hypothetical protein